MTKSVVPGPGLKSWPMPIYIYIYIYIQYIYIYIYIYIYSICIYIYIGLSWFVCTLGTSHLLVLDQHQKRHFLHENRVYRASVDPSGLQRGPVWFTTTRDLTMVTWWYNGNGRYYSHGNSDPNTYYVYCIYIHTHIYISWYIIIMHSISSDVQYCEWWQIEKLFRSQAQIVGHR